MSTIEGFVYIPPDYWITRNGNEAGKFFIKTNKGDKYQVLAFGHVLKRVKKEISQESKDRIIIEGQIEEQIDAFGHTDEVKVIKAKSFRLPDKKPTERDKAIAKAGGVEAHKRWLEEEAKRKRELGFEYVPLTGLGFVWKKREFCLMVNGEWKSQVEWAMDVLGAKEVTEMLREKNINYGVARTKEQKKALREIVNLAIIDSGEEIKFSDEVQQVQSPASDR